MKHSIILMAAIGVIAAACHHVPQTASATSTSAPQKIATQMTDTHTPTIKTRISAYDFPETIRRVEAAIEKRPLTLFAQIDHAAGAAKAGLELAPSTVFIFGNPKGGTPLMARNPQMGIALPLKLHVYQDGGVVTISYTDIEAVAKSHGLDSAKLPIPNIVKMLDGLAEEAAAGS